MEGLDNLRRTVEPAGDRLIVMGCGALDATNIAEVRRRAGLHELHFAALKTEPSAMTFRNPQVGMGGTAPRPRIREHAHRHRTRCAGSSQRPARADGSDGKRGLTAPSRPDSVRRQFGSEAGRGNRHLHVRRHHARLEDRPRHQRRAALRGNSRRGKACRRGRPRRLRRRRAPSPRSADLLAGRRHGGGRRGHEAHPPDQRGHHPLHPRPGPRLPGFRHRRPPLRRARRADRRARRLRRIVPALRPRRLPTTTRSSPKSSTCS